jgi:tetratricopeptide (TPR) repeat protein
MAHLAEGLAWRERAQTAGDRAAETDALRQSVAHFALAVEEDESAVAELAGASRRLADILADDDQWPEAMQAYQEATDAFGRMEGHEEDAASCARRIQDGVRALRYRPAERLLLLTARYERELRSLEVQPGTEKQQGACVHHIATILHRCGRHRDAALRYEEAIRLFDRAEEAGLEHARTAKRLGDLYFGPLEDEVLAFRYYRRAERGFSLEEELSESDWLAQDECKRRLRELATDLSEIMG